MRASSIIRPFWPILFITLVVLISVTLLTVTESVTRAQMEAQQQQKILGLLEEMFPGMSDYDYDLEDDIYIVYADSVKIGYAFLAVGEGYGGDIDILVGLEDESTIKGIIIISQQETPGLGARITENSFTDQFMGLNINAVALKKDGGQVDGITGATISSKAVIDAVRETAMEKVKSLK